MIEKSSSKSAKEVNEQCYERREKRRTSFLMKKKKQYTGGLSTMPQKLKKKHVKRESQNCGGRVNNSLYPP